MEYKLTDEDIYELLSMLHTTSLAAEEHAFTSNELSRVQKAATECLSQATQALKDPDIVGFRLLTIDKNGYFCHAAFGDTTVMARLLMEDYEHNLKLQMAISDAHLNSSKEYLIAHSKNDPAFYAAVQEMKALIRKPTYKDDAVETILIPKDSVTIQ